MQTHADLAYPDHNTSKGCIPVSKQHTGQRPATVKAELPRPEGWVENSEPLQVPNSLVRTPAMSAPLPAVRPPSQGTQIALSLLVSLSKQKGLETESTGEVAW